MADGNISNVNPDLGLTDAQVQAQIKSGHKNTAEQSLTRSVREICRIIFLRSLI